MLSNHIKEATKISHQELEGKVVRKLKAIRSDSDYAELLKSFYAYFSKLEQEMRPYLSASVLPDYEDRRHSDYLRKDIEELGSDVLELPAVKVPRIQSATEALSALYVMEGSIMGGPYIVQMLRKGGIEKGLSFFSGYGEDTSKMWMAFTEILNQRIVTEADQILAVDTANATFSNFSTVFEQQQIL